MSRPYFLSWAPDRLSVLTKRNVHELERIDLDPDTGSVVARCRLPRYCKLGNFATPVWVSSVRRVPLFESA